MHLSYDLITAALEYNENRHPQEVMRELGISCQYAVPQSISDSWEFWNCENIPENMPKFLTVSDWDPMDKIDFGLSKDAAEKIRDYSVKQEDMFLNNINIDHNIIGMHFVGNRKSKSVIEQMRKLKRRYEATGKGLWPIYVKAYSFDVFMKQQK